MDMSVVTTTSDRHMESQVSMLQGQSFEQYAAYMKKVKGALRMIDIELEKKLPPRKVLDVFCTSLWLWSCVCRVELPAIIEAFQASGTLDPTVFYDILMITDSQRKAALRAYEKITGRIQDIELLDMDLGRNVDLQLDAELLEVVCKCAEDAVDDVLHNRNGNAEWFPFLMKEVRLCLTGLKMAGRQVMSTWKPTATQHPLPNAF
eukprot:jgi/Botrbrau1/8081/Bobra.0230s0008.1